MKLLMPTFVEIQLKKENLKDVKVWVPKPVQRSLNQPGYVIVWIIFLQTDYFIVQWPRGLGTGFPIQASQV